MSTMLARCLFVMASLGACTAHADRLVWPQGKRAAIVLTYDDALRSQLEIAIPQLNEARLVGTFFLDGDITPEEILAWRAAAKDGHELGNHSVFHPCPRSFFEGREHYATENYDPSTMLAEIRVMNNLLFGIDGKDARTYSYPCSQSVVGTVDYTDALRSSGLIRYARTGGDQFTAVVSEPHEIDEYQVPSWGFIDKPDGARLIAYVKRVQASSGLGVLQFHGVGGDYLDVSAQAHRELLRYLTEHPDIWVDEFQTVMDYIVAARQKIAPRELPRSSK